MLVKTSKILLGSRVKGTDLLMWTFFFPFLKLHPLICPVWVHQCHVWSCFHHGLWGIMSDMWLKFTALCQGMCMFVCFFSFLFLFFTWAKHWSCFSPVKQTRPIFSSRTGHGHCRDAKWKVMPEHGFLPFLFFYGGCCGWVTPAVKQLTMWTFQPFLVRRFVTWQ